MNVLGKLATVFVSTTIAGLTAENVLVYWRKRSSDATSRISHVRRFVRDNREVCAVYVIVATGMTYKLFRTKHVCIDDSGATGYFDDGTVRLDADKLKRLVDTGKSARLNIQYIGDFIVKPAVEVSHG